MNSVSNRGSYNSEVKEHDLFLIVENHCFDSCCKDVSTLDYWYIGNQLKPKASCEVVMGMPREIGSDPRNK